MKFTIPCLFVVLFFLTVTVTAIAQPESNLSRFEQLFSEILDDADSLFAARDFSSILVLGPVEQTGAGWFLRSSLIRHLENKVDRIYWQDTQTADLILEFQVIETAVNYSSLEHGFQRTVSATVEFLLKDQNKIAVNQQLQKALSDTLPNNDFLKMENDLYPFTIGEKPESGSWHKWIEPGLVAGLSAGIIYMFYSFRSE